MKKVKLLSLLSVLALLINVVGTSFSGLNVRALDEIETEKNVQDIEQTQDTTDAEIEFSLAFLDSLPKEGEEGFDDFLKLAKPEDLNENVKYEIKHMDDTTETVNINEKEVYKQIETTVQEIIQKVKNRTPEEELTEEEIELKISNNEVSKNYKLPEQMRVAKAIYRWVAKNIEYDDESIAENSKDVESSRKPQTALFVYDQKTGICAGKANLLKLMMRMAGIPCAKIGTTENNKGIRHAYNAVYLKDTTNNREGWTLLDSTQAASDSESENIEDLIEGTGYFYQGWIEYKFNRNDDYTKEIEKLYDISYDEQKKMDDNAVAELNKSTEEKLKELNENRTDGIKFEKIEFVKDTYDGSLIIKYKTNLSPSDVKEINREKREKYIKSFMYMKSYGSMEIYDDLSLFGVREGTELNKINSKKDDTKSDKSSEYSEKVNEIYSSIVKKYSYNKYENIENINNEIQNELAKLNLEYQDVVTFKSLNIIKDDYGYVVEANTSLSYDEARNLIAEESQIQSDMKLFFAGFYNTNIDFTEANRSILKETTHKILYADKATGVNDLWEIYEFRVDGVAYELCGQEGNSIIELSGRGENSVENVQIPSELANLGIKFRVRYGIKSIILRGDETIEIIDDCDLESIDTTNSNKYIFENGILYGKNPDGSKGTLLQIFKASGEINSVNYIIEKENDSNKVTAASIYSWAETVENLELPEFLTQFNVLIKIGSGIRSIILKGDETIDITDASDLENVDTTNSDKYIFENGTLYEKNPDGTKGKLLQFKTNGKINGISYSIEKEDGGDKVTAVSVCNYDEPLENLELPEFLTQFNVPIKIGSGIRSIILKGDETIDTVEAYTLKSIDTKNSNKYIFENGMLYEKNANGTKGDLLKIFETMGEINGVNYSIERENGGDRITGVKIYNYNEIIENLELPGFLTQFNVPIEISYGIKSIILKGDETIDIAGVYALERINITNSNKYYAKDNELYEKDSNNKVSMPAGVAIVE